MDRIYVSDLDFTLANSNKKLSAFTTRSIKLYHEKNIRFAIATARAYETARKIIGDLPILAIIEYNGGIVRNYNTGKILSKNTIDASLASSVLSKIQELGIDPFISTLDGDNNLLYYSDTLTAGQELYLNNRKNDPRLRKIDKDNGILHGDILSYTIIAEKSLTEELKNSLSTYDGLSIQHYKSEYEKIEDYWLSIHAAKSTKGLAIKQMMRIFEIQGELIVFGDNTNDISMFEVADRSYAVANAKHRLKLKATDIIGSNDEDAVVQFINEENNLSMK